ncbi:MAG TPA: GNAT family N-acetyltransferase [Gaiellaceae bacterium]|jgi:GNAT superfamily N-acetyltransferase
MSERAEPVIRPARAGDGPALARMHREFASYYLGLEPRDFRMPAEEGLVDYLESLIDADPSEVELVAEAGGEIVGAVWARVVPQQADGRYQVVPTAEETQLHIDYLVTDEAHRRSGVGTALVAAAEQWGRDRGATVALTVTYAASPLSIPFWQERMGYRTRSVNLVKRL